MSDRLIGRAQGSSLAAIRKSAEQIAEKFFGTACVRVELTGPIEMKNPLSTMATAPFEARENHDLWQPPRGFPKCSECDRYSSTLYKLPTWNGRTDDE